MTPREFLAAYSASIAKNEPDGGFKASRLSLADGLRCHPGSATPDQFESLLDDVERNRVQARWDEVAVLPQLRLKWHEWKDEPIYR
jgi:hypothetical protein